MEKAESVFIGVHRWLGVSVWALEEEFPGIGFRYAAGGREAYVLGQRVAVWEVVDVYREAKAISRTADHFGWPEQMTAGPADWLEKVSAAT